MQTLFVMPKYKKGWLVKLKNGSEAVITKIINEKGNYWYVVNSIPYAEFEIVEVLKK